MSAIWLNIIAEAMYKSFRRAGQARSLLQRASPGSFPPSSSTAPPSARFVAPPAAPGPPSRLSNFEKLNEHAANGNLQMAEAVFPIVLAELDRLEAENVTRNSRNSRANFPTGGSVASKRTMLFNTMLKCAANRGDVRAAMKYYQRMLDSNVNTNVKTYGKLVEACAKGGDLAGAESWWQTMEQLRVDTNYREPSMWGVKSDDRIESGARVRYNIMLDGCAKAGNPGAAVAWFDRLLAANIKPDVRSYSCVIEAHVPSGDSNIALSWFVRMRRELGKASYSFVGNGAFVNALKACARAKDADTALQIFEIALSQQQELDDEEERRRPPQEAAYGLLLYTLGVNGRKDDAVEWMRRMANSGVPPTTSCYNSVLQAHIVQKDLEGNAIL